MTLKPLGVFVKKWQPEVGLAGYVKLLAYFVVEAKSKNYVKAHEMDYMLFATVI